MIHANHGVLSTRGKFSCHHQIHRKHDLATVGLGICNHFACSIGHVFFTQRFAYVIAIGKQERIGHTAADDDHVDFFRQVGKHFHFGGHFGPTNNGGHRLLRFAQGATQGFQFGLHQTTGCGGQLARQRFGGCMSAVCGGKSIVHINIAKRRKLAGKTVIVVGFFGVKAHIFKHRHIAVVHGGDHGFGAVADGVGGKRHITAQRVRHGIGHGLEAQLRNHLTLGAAKV